MGTATRLTAMLKGWMSPVMPTVAGTNTTAMDNWAIAAETSHERGRGRGAKNPSNTATAPKDSQNPTD